jgi:hypothetical protein
MATSALSLASGPSEASNRLRIPATTSGLVAKRGQMPRDKIRGYRKWDSLNPSSIPFHSKPSTKPNTKELNQNKTKRNAVHCNESNEEEMRVST